MKVTNFGCRGGDPTLIGEGSERKRGRKLQAASLNISFKEFSGKERNGMVARGGCGVKRFFLFFF